MASHISHLKVVNINDCGEVVSTKEFLRLPKQSKKSCNISTDCIRKPKIANNIHEVRSIIKLRKRLRKIWFHKKSNKCLNKSNTLSTESYPNGNEDRIGFSFSKELNSQSSEKQKNIDTSQSPVSEFNDILKQTRDRFRGNRIECTSVKNSRKKCAAVELNSEPSDIKTESLSVNVKINSCENLNKEGTNKCINSVSSFCNNIIKKNCLQCSQKTEIDDHICSANETLLNFAEKLPIQSNIIDSAFDGYKIVKTVSIKTCEMCVLDDFQNTKETLNDGNDVHIDTVLQTIERQKKSSQQCKCKMKSSVKISNPKKKYVNTSVNTDVGAFQSGTEESPSTLPELQTSEDTHELLSANGKELKYTDGSLKASAANNNEENSDTFSPKIFFVQKPFNGFVQKPTRTYMKKKINKVDTDNMVNSSVANDNAFQTLENTQELLSANGKELKNSEGSSKTLAANNIEQNISNITFKPSAVDKNELRVANQQGASNSSVANDNASAANNSEENSDTFSPIIQKPFFNYARSVQKPTHTYMRKKNNKVDTDNVVNSSVANDNELQTLDDTHELLSANGKELENSEGSSKASAANNIEQNISNITFKPSAVDKNELRVANQHGASTVAEKQLHASDSTTIPAIINNDGNISNSVINSCKLNVSDGDLKISNGKLKISLNTNIPSDVLKSSNMTCLQLPRNIVLKVVKPATDSSGGNSEVQLISVNNVKLVLNTDNQSGCNNSSPSSINTDSTNTTEAEGASDKINSVIAEVGRSCRQDALTEKISVSASDHQQKLFNIQKNIVSITRVSEHDIPKSRSLRSVIPEKSQPSNINGNESQKNDTLISDLNINKEAMVQNSISQKQKNETDNSVSSSDLLRIVRARLLSIVAKDVRLGGTSEHRETDTDKKEGSKSYNKRRQRIRDEIDCNKEQIYNKQTSSYHSGTINHIKSKDKKKPHLKRLRRKKHCSKAQEDSRKFEKHKCKNTKFIKNIDKISMRSGYSSKSISHEEYAKKRTDEHDVLHERDIIQEGHLIDEAEVSVKLAITPDGIPKIIKPKISKNILKAQEDSKKFKKNKRKNGKFIKNIDKISMKNGYSSTSILHEEQAKKRTDEHDVLQEGDIILEEYLINGADVSVKLAITPHGIPKIIKPKIAKNILEVRKIIRIEKKLQRKIKKNLNNKQYYMNINTKLQKTRKKLICKQVTLPDLLVSPFDTSKMSVPDFLLPEVCIQPLDLNSVHRKVISAYNKCDERYKRQKCISEAENNNLVEYHDNASCDVNLKCNESCDNNNYVVDNCVPNTDGNHCQPIIESVQIGQDSSNFNDHVSSPVRVEEIPQLWCGELWYPHTFTAEQLML